jgi:hypothetical protein
MSTDAVDAWALQPDRQLAATGVDASLLIWIAVALLVAGVLALAVSAVRR